MARTADYSNIHKYDNRKSFDGAPVPAGKVLVPFRKEIYGLQKGDYIQANFTIICLGEIKYEIGFMPINKAQFSSYMEEFWNEINEDVKMRHEDRCIIGKNPDGSNKLCPFTRHCKDCPDKGLLKRHNPNQAELLSLDYEYDSKSFDIADERHPSVEDQVLDAMCPEPAEEDLWSKLLDHFDKKSPRYAKIIRLSLRKKSIDEICIELNLDPSHGCQEIDNAYNAVCDYLRLRHYKKKTRK